MRSFVDASGSRWDVVLGRESWGAFFAIFVPKGTEDEQGERGIRQAMLVGASDGAEANRILDALDDTRLQELLSESERKDLG